MRISTSLTCSALLLAAGSITGFFRHRLLSHLESELLLHHGSVASAGSAPSEEKSHIRDRNEWRETAQPLTRSAAGRENIPEARQCLDAYLARKRMAIPERNHYPEIDRLKELLAEMGADTFEQLLHDCPEGPQGNSERDFLESTYASMNPSQALLSAIEKPPSSDQHAALQAFTFWSYADPEAAIHWQQDASAQGNPTAASTAIQIQTAICCSRIDPQQAVGIIDHLIRIAPGEVSPEIGTGIARALRTPEERIFLLKALDVTSAHSQDGDMFTPIRTAVVKWLNYELPRCSFSEATVVVDEAFSPEEQQAFVRSNRMYAGSAEEAGKWAAWLSSYDDGPGLSSSPVFRFLGENVERFPDLLNNPEWIKEAPNHEGQQRALRIVIQGLQQTNPDTARQWLEKLDDGPAKEQLRSGF